MAFDIAVDENGMLSFDEFSDIETVRGNENVRQQIRLAVTTNTGRITNRQLTQETKRKLRSDVLDALKACPYVDTVVSITIYSPNDETIRIDAQTRSGDITVTF